MAAPVPVLASPPTMMDDSDELYLYPSQASTADSAPLDDVEVPPQQDESQLSAYWQNDGVFEDADALVAVHMTHKQEALEGPGAKRKQPLLAVVPKFARVSTARPLPALSSPSSANSPGGTPPSTSPPNEPLPFPLMFVLHAAGVDDVSLPVSKVLVDAYRQHGWAGVAVATSKGLSGVPGTGSIKVVEPAQLRPDKPHVLGYRVRFDVQRQEVQYQWPRLRPETKADRVLGAELLLQVEMVTASDGESSSSSARRGLCYKCNEPGHFAKDCRKGEAVCYKCHEPGHFAKECRKGEADPNALRQALLERKAAEKERSCSIFEHGCLVCGRTYAFLGSKDKGQTLFFVAVSGTPLDELQLGRRSLHFWNVEEALRALADFRACATVPKMCARVELSFSGTSSVFAGRPFRALDLRGRGLGGAWSPALEATLMGELSRISGTRCKDEIVVVAIDDLLGMAEGDQPAVSPSGGPYLMSDGCGMISLNLAEQLTRTLCWDHVYLLTQIRLWWGGGFLAKGVLFTSAALPPNVILVRDSQIKVNAREPAPCCCVASLEVNDCQRKPGEAATSPFLVPLLEYLGGPACVELMLRWQREAAAPIAKLISLVDSGGALSDENASLLISELISEQRAADAALPGKVDVQRMLRAGCDPSDEHVRTEAIRSLRDKLNVIQSGRFSIPDSYTMMVAIDHTGTLLEGEVVLLEAGVPRVAERCVLYKSPGIHPGDVRVLRAVPPSAEMREHLGFAPNGQHALIVSCRGRRSILDMIAGCDADGDRFSIIFDAELLGCLPPDRLQPPWEKRPRAPPPHAPLPPASAPWMLSEDERCRAMIEHVRRCKAGQKAMTQAAQSWKAWVHKQGPDGAGDEGAKELCALYMEALDSSKADAGLTSLEKRFSSCPLPRHLWKNRAMAPMARMRDVHGSGGGGLGHVDQPALLPKTALLRMFEAVESDAITGGTPRQTCPKVIVDLDLKVSVTDEARHQTQKNFWFSKYHEYKEEMRKLGEAYSPERWKGIVGDVRRELLATSGDSAYDGGIPNAALRESVCVLYEALYDSSGALKCGECAVPSVRDEDL